MPTHWETTPEDILHVLAAHEFSVYDGFDPKVGRIYGSLTDEEHNRIANATLDLFDMDKRTSAAMEELELLLFEKGIIASDKDKKFRYLKKD